MEVDFGPSWKESFYAYVTPDVSTFYNETAGSRKAVEPRFSGTFGKFINLSKDILIVYWDPGSNSGGQKPSYIATLEPFGSSGTATYIGHQFFVTKANDAAANADPASHVLHRWKIERGNSLYYYDPYGSTEAAMKELGEQSSDLQYYQMQLQNLVFAQQYKAFTNGVDYLALYKQKQPPRFHMWRADFFGQTHIVETKEIHFVETPDDDELLRGMSIYGPRPDEVTRMRKYRDTHPTLSLELKVLSCAPRVFEIKNFLSDVEVDHILRIASTKNLHRSTVSAAGAGNKKGGAGDTSDTRTSRNDWIGRHADFMIDAIYKRSADLLQMNEALLRTRRGTEIPEFTESKITIAEKLQLVHYDVGQKYTPHHDFAMPGLVNLQPSRFATILFYLNDDMKGGETTFPRWLNAETSEPLSVGSTLLTCLMISHWQSRQIELDYILTIHSFSAPFLSK